MVRWRKFRKNSLEQILEYAKILEKSKKKISQIEKLFSRLQS
jgi:hypothetical protein